MSDDKLVVLNNSNPLAMGGVGLGSALFKAKPSYIQLVPKSTRQEGAIPGTFRISSSGERIGVTDANGNVIKDEFKAVLLAVPQEQREYYLNDGKTYSKDMKECFSLDNVQPHSKAKAPPAMFCGTCPMGDINWKKWREGGKTPDLLPKCQMYYHLFIAERSTQTPYNLDVKGKSVLVFKTAMETQMSGLLAKIQANAVMINKSRGYKLNKNTNVFEFVGLPEGVTEQVAPEPLPNIFDIVFTVYSTKKDGDIVMGFKDFARMKAEDRQEFGGLYAEFLQRKQERAEQAALTEGVSEEEQGNAAVTEVVEGEYVAGKDEPITI
jgi:hypothetical protein